MRISWIDNLKGLGIILIIMGHSIFPDGSIVVKYIFSFHVALFFFISGFLFNDTKHNNFKIFLKNRFQRLIIPFVFFNFFMFSFYKIKEFFGGTPFISDFSVFIKGVLYGSYIPQNSEVILANIPTWFLLSLFMVSIYYYFINKMLPNKYIKIGVLFFISILIFLESHYTTMRLPWSAEISLMAMLFYGIGHSYRSEIKNAISSINFYYLFIIPILVIISIMSLNPTNFSTNYYGENYFLFLLSSASGILTFIIISKLLQSNKLLSFLGINSIIVFGFEWINFILLSLVIKLSFGHIILEKTYSIAILQIFITIIAMFPMVYVINNYFPFILGIFKAKKEK